MSEKKNVLDLISSDEQNKKERQSAADSKITFREYLKLVSENPLIAQTSQSRIYNMILDAGVSELSPAEREFSGANNEFHFFSKHLRGVDGSISEIMEFFKAGASDLSIGKKVLLLFGPPASGKSTFAEILKKGLESYREPPMFRIKDCPINEEPLHILPMGMREEFEEALGIKIQGDLCPVCRHNLKNRVKNGESYYDMEVERFSISRRTSTGIGRFEPADEKAQDISDVTAKENVSVTMNPNRGFDDPYAYCFVGAIPRGNRGFVEGVEFVKKGIDPKILWTFINLNEERILAVPGSNMPPVHIDTIVIGHCNIVGFKWFSGDAGHEALQSRIYAIPFPYALRIKDEVEIYKKLLGQSSAHTHISPGALELVALFAVSTRLNPDNNFSSILDKAMFIDGRVVASAAEKRLDLKGVLKKGHDDIEDVGKRDGMFGVSPRDIMTALSKAVISDKGCKCLTAKKAMTFILNNFDNMMGGTPELTKSWKELLTEEIDEEYKKRVRTIIETAFLSAYGDVALEKAKRYMGDIKLHCQKKRKQSGPRSSEIDAEPDYKEMAKIEACMGLTSNEDREAARGELYQMYLEYLQDNDQLNLDDFPKLQEAIHAVLLAEMSTNMLNVLDLSEKPATGDEAKRARRHKDDLVTGLKDMGFCEDCIPEIIREARNILKS